MANRDLLKEAIADAKAVKETAIANAKAALEEAFAPRMQELLKVKLEEMDKDIEEAEEVTEGDDIYETEDNMEEAMDDTVEEAMDDKVEENEVDLEELLRELDELEEEDSVEETEEPVMEAEEEEAKEMEDTEEEEIDLENMSEDDLKKFIEDVIADMVEAGELEAGEGMEGEEEDEEEGEEEVEINERKKYGGNKGDVPAAKRGDKKDIAEEEGAEDEIAAALNKVHDDKSLDSEPEIKKALADLEKKVHEGADLEEGQINEGYGVFLPIIKMIAAKFGIGMAGATVVAGMIPFTAIATGAVTAVMIAKAVKAYKEKKAAGDLAEALKTVEILKTELNEVNLFNSKLLYTNKIFKAKNLTEAQKVKVLTTFDKAETVKEVKLIYETLSEGMVAKKEAIKESKSYASKAVGVSPKQPVVETNDMVNRFKKLAGLK